MLRPITTGKGFVDADDAGRIGAILRLEGVALLQRNAQRAAAWIRNDLEARFVVELETQ